LQSAFKDLLVELPLALSTSSRLQSTVHTLCAAAIRSKILCHYQLIFIYFFHVNQWINFLQAMSWSYSDILIILLAIGIKYRFKQVNQRFKYIVSDETLMTHQNFHTLRIHYYQLIDLVHYIDSLVNTLIFMSLGHNTLVLIIKIFEALKWGLKKKNEKSSFNNFSILILVQRATTFWMTFTFGFTLFISQRGYFACSIYVQAFTKRRNTQHCWSAKYQQSIGQLT
jgi:hypothetical protein